MFYSYWFEHGRKALNVPLENALLKNKKRLGVYFFFSWANEAWTRRWNGRERDKDVFIRQAYGNSYEWKKHFDYLQKFPKEHIRAISPTTAVHSCRGQTILVIDPQKAVYYCTNPNGPAFQELLATQLNRSIGDTNGCKKPVPGSVNRFVLINAWNEWGEQAVLEPNQFDGDLFLRHHEAAIQSIIPCEFWRRGKKCYPKRPATI